MSSQHSDNKKAKRTRTPLVPLVGLLTAIVVAAALKATGTILIPLIISIFLCYLISPIMSGLARLRLPEIMTIPVIIVFLLGIFLLLDLIVVNTISQIAEQAPVYQQRVESMVEGLIERLGPNSTILTEVNWIERLMQAASSMSVSVFGSLVNFVAKLVLVLMYTGFILAGQKALSSRVIKAYSKERSDEIQAMLKKINVAVQRYLVTKILVSLLTGALMFVVLLIFGVDFALFWGLLGFLLNFIPSVGSVIAVMFPITVALLQFESPLTALWVALSLIAVQQILGSVVDPIVTGRRLNLSPIVILFALVFFGWLWGFWGMVLSIPLTSVIKIAMEQTRSLKPIAIMLEKT